VLRVKVERMKEMKREEVFVKREGLQRELLIFFEIRASAKRCLF
jgi:hypothetical protein